jgi:hypothetical protein
MSMKLTGTEGSTVLSSAGNANQNCFTVKKATDYFGRTWAITQIRTQTRTLSLSIS